METVVSVTSKYNCTRCKDNGYIKHMGQVINCPACSASYSCTMWYDTGYYDGHISKQHCTTCDYHKKKNPLLVVKKQDIGYSFENTLENIKKKPNYENLKVVPAAPNQIQIDYDSEEIPEQFEKVLNILRKRFTKGYIHWDKYRSSSGKRWHVVVTCPENITNQERVIWQSVFGSDYVREALNLLKIVNNIENPISLYMAKDGVPIESGILNEPAGRKFKEVV